MVRRLLILVALTPILMADTCGDQNACNQPPPGVGGTVVTAQAATDPCAGQPPLHVVVWYAQGGVRYPLRCGRRDPKGYGYLHIRYDERGHGDPANDPTFSAEIATTGTRRRGLRGRRELPLHPEVRRRQEHVPEWSVGLPGGAGEGAAVLEDISLQSQPDAWPAVIRLDYRIGDKRGRWEEEWGEELEVGSVEAAAGLWLAIVHIHLMDLREPLPEHMRAAS
jgi:hypothetical protein